MDCAKPLSQTVVDYALRHFAQPSPKFFDDEFEEICLDLVESVFGVDITEELSATYRKGIYIYLVNTVTDY